MSLQKHLKNTLKNTFLLVVRAMVPLKAFTVHIGLLRGLDNVHMLLILKECEMCYINECFPRLSKESHPARQCVAEESLGAPSDV